MTPPREGRELGRVLEAILAGVVVLDAEGRVDEINSVACRMCEHSREQSVGQPVEALITRDHTLARLGRKALAQGVGFTENQQTIEMRSGERLKVDVAATPLFDEEGGLDGAVLVLRDRSRANRLEQLEAEKERFDAFGRIAAGLAHEIKNPLGGIRGAGEILARRSQDEKTHEIAELVVNEASRIASLVDDFMVFARGDRLELAPVNVHEVLDRVLDLVGMDDALQGPEFVRSYDPSIPDLLADRDRLVQVFLNLVRNGLQAMDGVGGALTVETRMTLDHRLVTRDGRSVPTLAVVVQDTGRGMDEEELRQAGTPFFTTRTGGTGLGLAVAEYWVAQHEGTLSLESKKGVGTRARVALPLRRQRA